MIDLLDAAGGPTEPLQALLVGGYFGTWVDASSAASLRLAREDLRSVGCSLGSGVLIALGESSCGLHESARVIAYLADQSAGQCGPCVYGLRSIADSVGALASGVAHPRERGPGAPLDVRDPRPRRLPPPRRRRALRRERALGVRAGDRLAPAPALPRPAGGAALGGRAVAPDALRHDDERAAARQPDHVRGPRAVRGAAARADPPRRLGLPDHRSSPRCRPTCSGSPGAPSTPARRSRCCSTRTASPAAPAATSRRPTTSRA